MYLYVLDLLCVTDGSLLFGGWYGVLPLLALLDLTSYFLSLLQLTELIYKQLLFLFFLFCLLNNMVIQNN